VYNAPGAWNIAVLVYDARANVPQYVPYGVSYGDSWSQYTTQFVTYDASAGFVSGDIYLYSQNDDDYSYYYGKQSSDNWIVRGPVQYCQRGYCSTLAGYADRKVGGQARFTFNAKFIVDTYGAIHSTGNTSLSWYSAGISFLSVNHTRLTLFAPTQLGPSALWTGYGIYSLMPNYILPFSCYVVDTGGKADYFHFRLTDLKGVVLFDTAPGAANMTSLPKTSISSGSLSITNPPATTISGVTQNDALGAGSVGAIVGATVSLAALVIIVGVIIYLLLKRNSSASVTVNVGDSFREMPRN
jgi:hypothetical protein